MAIRLEDKQQIVAEVNEAAKGALSAVLADYHGTAVEEMTALRKAARENNVYLRVVRNTLLKRAVAGTDYECLNEALVVRLSVTASKSFRYCCDAQLVMTRRPLFEHFNRGLLDLRSLNKRLLNSSASAPELTQFHTESDAFPGQSGAK